MPLTLEQSLLALMEEHNLTSISIGMIRNAGSKSFPSAYAQGGGFCGSAGRFDLSLVDSVAAAIFELNAQRNPLPVLELPALEVVVPDADRTVDDYDCWSE
jgi:hypothetical protein